MPGVGGCLPPRIETALGQARRRFRALSGTDSYLALLLSVIIKRYLGDEGGPTKLNPNLCRWGNGWHLWFEQEAKQARGNKGIWGW